MGRDGCQLRSVKQGHVALLPSPCQGAGFSWLQWSTDKHLQVGSWFCLQMWSLAGQRTDLLPPRPVRALHLVTGNPVTVFLGDHRGWLQRFRLPCMLGGQSRKVLCSHWKVQFKCSCGWSVLCSPWQRGWGWELPAEYSHTTLEETYHAKLGCHLDTCPTFEDWPSSLTPPNTYL